MVVVMMPVMNCMRSMVGVMVVMVMMVMGYDRAESRAIGRASAGCMLGGVAGAMGRLAMQL